MNCNWERNMRIRVFNDKATLGKAAADQAGTAMRQAIAQRGRTRIVAATAASQLEFLDSLTRAQGIDWQNVEVSIWMSTSAYPSPIPVAFARCFLSSWSGKPV